MSAQLPQTKTRSESSQNIVQSLCRKSCSISNKYSDIKIYGSKLSLKQNNSFRLLFEIVNRLHPNIGYYLFSLKYKCLEHMIMRFQANAVCIAETQINPALILLTFLMRDKLFKEKESVSILTNKKQEHLGMR